MATVRHVSPSMNKVNYCYYGHRNKTYIQNCIKILSKLPASSTTIINIPITITTDFYLNIFTQKVRNYFVAAGHSGLGISHAAGIGDVLSQWITNGHPPLDVTPLDIKRFVSHHNNKRYLRDRVQGSNGLLFALPYPRKEVTFSRKVKCPVLYTTLDKAGASWGDRMGWETPNWFALTPDGKEAFNCMM